MSENKRVIRCTKCFKVMGMNEPSYRGAKDGYCGSCFEDFTSQNKVTAITQSAIAMKGEK